MAVGDGNGWVRCRCGHRHWGRHGAAGLVLLRGGPAQVTARSGSTGGTPGDGTSRPGAPADHTPGPGAPVEVLLQLRAGWTHQGGCWGLVGGARDSQESVEQAALREAAEEAGVEPAAVRVLGTHVGVDHGDWRYTYVLGRAGPSVRPYVATTESDAVRWTPLPEVPSLPLHPGLAGSWTALFAAVAETLAGT